MTRKLFCSMIVMTIAIGFVAADEFVAVIVKVDGDKVTYQKFKKGDKGKKGKGEKDGDPVTLPVAKDAKITKGKGSFKDMKFSVEPGDPIEGGLKADIFKNATEEKGVFAGITRSEDKKTITAIATVQFGKKKDKDK
jgi:hypothetical protein